jgi:hypothetical protein
MENITSMDAMPPQVVIGRPSCLKPMKNDAGPARSGDEQHAVPAVPEW